MEVEFRAESLWESTDHVTAFNGIHVLFKADIARRIQRPRGIEAFRIIELDIGQVFNERSVETTEMGKVVSYNICHFRGVFSWEGHSWVAHVADTCNGTVELFFCESGWEKEKGGSKGGNEVYLIGEADSGIVTKDFDRLMESPSKVEGGPFGKVSTERIEIDNTIFDECTIDSNIWIEVNTSSPSLLNSCNSC